MTTTVERPQSGVPGIRWRDGRSTWGVTKKCRGVEYWLGSYKDLDDAKAAMDAWDPSPEGLAKAATPKRPPSSAPQLYAPQRIHADGFPTLGRTRMTDEQIAYALSIAHELRGF